eukprot:PhF_6_TR25315/c1_g1_i9/m.34960
MGCVQSFLNRNATSPQPLEQKCRKAFILLMAFVWVAFIFDLILTFIILEKNTSAEIIRRVGYFVMTVLAPYGFVRAYREPMTSDFTISYFIQICGFVNTYNSLVSLPTRPNDQVSILLLILISVMKIPHFKIQSFTLILGFVIMSYNCSFGLYEGYPSLHIVEPDQGSAILEALMHCRTFIALPLSMMVVRAYCRTYQESISKLEATLEVVQKVSKHLTEYDIDNAENVLVGVDRKTWDALSDIVNTMKTYKPYLPNYVIKNIVVDDHNKQDDEEQKQQQFHFPTTHPSSEEDEMVSICEVVTDPKVTNQACIESLRLLSSYVVRRTMSYAMIYFKNRSKDIIENPKPIEQFIDEVYRTVNGTLGAVHSCVGNTIHITWNAVTAVSTPKQYAASSMRYLSSVSRDMQFSSTSEFEMFSSVISGISECRVLGSHHRSVLIGIDWDTKMYDLHRFCREHETNVICGETKKEAKDSPVIAVDVLDGSRVTVYELTSSAIQRVYGEMMEKVIVAYKAGNFGQASDILNGMLRQYDAPVDQSVFETVKPHSLLQLTSLQHFIGKVSDKTTPVF